MKIYHFALTILIIPTILLSSPSKKPQPEEFEKITGKYVQFTHFNLQELRRKADLNDTEAQALLGSLSVDRGERIYWYRKAAENGDISCQVGMGNRYSSGYDGTVKFPHDFEQAVYYYSLAANQGSIMAQYALGEIYKEGKLDGKYDFEQAIYYLNKAIDNKSDNPSTISIYKPMALYMLGEIYESMSKFQNIDYAIKYYRLALEADPQKRMLENDPQRQIDRLLRKPEAQSIEKAPKNSILKTISELAPIVFAFIFLFLIIYALLARSKKLGSVISGDFLRYSLMMEKPFWRTIPKFSLQSLFFGKVNLNDNMVSWELISKSPSENYCNIVIRLMDGRFSNIKIKGKEYHNFVDTFHSRKRDAKDENSGLRNILSDNTHTPTKKPSSCCFITIILGLLLAGFVAYIQYDYDKNRPEYERKEFESYQADANRGDPFSQYRLAKAYIEGKFVPKDTRTAMYWYEMSARNGYLDAQYDLAKIYETNPEYQNISLAIKYYRMTANNPSTDGLNLVNDKIRKLARHRANTLEFQYTH